MAFSTSKLPSLASGAPYLYSTALVVLTLSVGLVSLVVLFQHKLIYPADFPPGSRDNVATPDSVGITDYEHLTLKTADGVALRAYLMLQATDPKDRATLLYLHLCAVSSSPTVKANAGNMGHRLAIAAQLFRLLRCNILMLSYRGYGLSEGTPSESGIRLDAQTALQYIMQHPVIGRTPVVLFGQSIGGAVAIDLASRNPDTVHAVMVENTFLSIPKLIPTVMPVLSPFAFLCHQIWPSYKSILRIPERTPILFLASERDEVVPPSHMHELYKLAQRTVPDDVDQGTTRNRVMVTFPQGTHNDPCVQPAYWPAIVDFWKRFVQE
ncbi:bem46 protein, variant [Sorochytrium milnesiophthora]